MKTWEIIACHGERVLTVFVVVAESMGKAIDKGREILAMTYKGQIDVICQPYSG